MGDDTSVTFDVSGRDVGTIGVDLRLNSNKLIGSGVQNSEKTSLNFGLSKLN